MVEIYMLLSVMASFLGVAGFTCGLVAIIKVCALEKSTHNVQYVPIDPAFEQESEKQAQTINKNFKEYVEEDFSDIINDQAY